MIEASNLRKRYGSTVAVDDLSFTVESGRVTGFLGPNGAGKSTTMRMMLGLDRCERGEVRFDGRDFLTLSKAMREVGALLDAGYVHPTRRARDHLWALAASNGIGRSRVDEVLALVGLSEVKRKRVGGFSLGMRQRLGLAGALLGDPHTLLFDEPANGLDPEGIQWMRHFMQGLAAEGRTVFVSSHLLAEMSLIAQDLVVIGRGRLIFQGPVTAFVAGAARHWVTVRSPQLPSIAQALTDGGAQVAANGADGVDVMGVEAPAIGELAARLGVVLHELSPRTGSLEEAFLQVTGGAEEFRAGPLPTGAPSPPALAGPPPGAAPPPPPPPPPGIDAGGPSS